MRAISKGAGRGGGGYKLHCKKGWPFSRPQPGCHLPNSPWSGKIKLFPARESLVSDIPAVDGKVANLFLQCIVKINSVVFPAIP